MKKLFFVLAGMLTLVACGTQDNGPILTIEGGQIQGVATDIKGQPSAVQMMGLWIRTEAPCWATL